MFLEHIFEVNKYLNESAPRLKMEFRFGLLWCYVRIPSNRQGEATYCKGFLAKVNILKLIFTKTQTTPSFVPIYLL
jgi:hypothetical protein